MIEGPEPAPVDRQRAAALLSHRATADEVGARFILGEASRSHRLTHLLAAVIDHGGQLLGALRTEMAIEAVASLYDTWANQEEDVDYRRGASCFLARLQGLPDIFHGHIADAEVDGRLTELVDTTAQTFLTVMPELHSPKGRASMAQIAAALHAKDEPEEQESD